MEAFDVPKKQAMEAYSAFYKEGKTPSLVEQLLYAILAQLDKANEQLALITSKEETSKKE